MTFSPTPRSKLAAAVAEQLLSDVRDRGLKPGERIRPERELMATFGVGRSTIREAINGLAILGVLETRHGQGAFVANPDAGAVLPAAVAAALARGLTRDLYEARWVVEPHVACLAAERRTESDLSQLAQALTDHRTAIEEGEPTVEPSVRFHVKIGEAAHSQVLASFVSSFAEIMIARGPVPKAEPGYSEWEIDQHRWLFEPIHRGDSELAAERMRTHLDAVVRRHERLKVP